MGYSKDKWEEWELDVIREWFPTHGASKCAEIITRHSKYSIAKKAQYIGVKADITAVRKNLGIKKVDAPKNIMMGRNGYLMIRTKDITMPYHRYIMEQHLGRKLLITEIVHHKDGNKHNNDISNLCIISRSDHMKLHKPRPKYQQDKI